MNILALITLSAATQTMVVPVNADNIPLEKFNAPNMAFNCSNNDFRTAGIYYADGVKQMDFNHFGSKGFVKSAILRDPVKWVKRESYETGSRYYIHGEGSQDNLPVTIDLIVDVPNDDYSRATFWVKTGDYKMSGQDCELIPTRPMPLPGDRK